MGRGTVNSPLLWLCGMMDISSKKFSRGRSYCLPVIFLPLWVYILLVTVGELGALASPHPRAR